MGKSLLEWTIVSWIANKMFPKRFKGRRLGEHLLSNSMASIIAAYVVSGLSGDTFWYYFMGLIYVDVLGYLQWKINNN